MATSPAFQFYPNDWLSSPRIMLMTPAEEGAYIRLLSICWMNGGLPDDDEQLAALSRLGADWFNGSGPKIRKCFKKQGTKLYNRRLMKERTKQRIWKEKSRQGGLKSAKRRKHKKLSGGDAGKGGSTTVPTKRQPKGNSSSSKEYSPNSTEFRLASLLLSEIQKRKADYKKPILQKWAVHVDRMIRFDGRKPESIERVIRWCQEDDFWKNNILSTVKLREHYDKLELKMGPKDAAPAPLTLIGDKTPAQILEEQRKLEREQNAGRG